MSTSATLLPVVPASAAGATAPNVGGEINYERFLDCVHCGLCTAACPTYLETGDENNSPRGRIYLMRSVVDGRLDLTPRVERHLDLCLDCRACETACPSGVQYGRLIEPFRASQRQAEAEAGHPKNRDWFHRWILYGIFPFANRMRWTLGPARIAQKLGLDRLAERIGLTKLLPIRLQRMQRLLPRLVPGGPALPDFLPAIGPRRARVALFTGCVADAVFRHTHWATARVLQQNGCDVVIPKNQVCCGAIHYHSGADGPALELARTNASAFAAVGVDAVIVNVAGCGSMLKDYGHIAHELEPHNESLEAALAACASKMRDVSEFLAELGLIPPPGEIRLRAVYHDACHLAHAQKIREQPRDLLSKIPGLEIVPIAEPDICCGAAGSYNLTEPEMSDRLAERKLNNIRAANPQAVITGNVGCSMQIQASLRQAGLDVWVAHPMELLDLSYRRQLPPG
ncbi:MAG TPA: heterodisulfide reductase-related iron-sulfur binding cluster [Planctomycetaceae bacterium]|nr:heterodisulfide reductase-related iron-sulfur binding cluster [Planctomycetaceae bacterium]